MPDADGQGLLRSHYLFGRLGEDEIAALLAHAHTERHPAGHEIFAKGAPGLSMMGVLRGSVSITALSPEGQQIVLNIIRAGEIFGEIALLDGGERTAAATAHTDCELLVVYRRDFLPLLERRSDLCLMLLQTLCGRLRQTSQQVEDMLFANLGARLAKALLQLARDDSIRDPSDGPGRPVVLRVTQQQLGNIVGGSRESVNRQLQAWQRAGLVALGKGTVAIRAPGRLERMI